jgi:DNA-binding CsgD family transcriptional regulator
MVTVEDFSRLVSEIYASSTSPGNWPTAMAEISRLLGGSGCGLISGEGTGRSVTAATVPAEAYAVYTAYYRTIDYVLDAVEKGPAGLIRGGQSLVALEDHSEFEIDFMRPFELDDGLFMRLTVGATPMSFLVAASKGPEPFDTAERVTLMGGLIGHMQQALRTQGKLASLADTALELAGALEVVRHGIVIIAAEHLVINLNSAAERVFRADDGLSLRSGRISATAARTDEELHCAVHNALDGERCAVRTGRSLTCRRPSGKRPYVIHVLPSRRRDCDEPLRRPMALVLIVDPEDEPEPTTALLRRLYHLTNAEAEVALHVMRGADLKQISEELSISLLTVRTHLHHVFDKTDTHRQAELVHLLLVLSP